MEPVTLDLWQFLVVAAGIIALSFVFVWALLRAANYEAPTTLIVALSLLTFFALAGAITQNSTELTTLAATGIGALAGAVSAQFTKTRRTQEQEQDQDQEVPDDGSAGG